MDEQLEVSRNRLIGRAMRLGMDMSACDCGEKVPDTWMVDGLCDLCQQNADPCQECGRLVRVQGLDRGLCGDCVMEVEP